MSQEQWKQYGGPANGTPQAEWSVSDDGMGMLTGTLKLFIEDPLFKQGGGSGGGSPSGAGSLFNVYKGNSGVTKSKTPPNQGLGEGIPMRGDPHPYEPALKCFGVTVNRGAMGIGYCDAQYVGLLYDPAGLEWEITCPTEDDSIETHPNFLKTGDDKKSSPTEKAKDESNQFKVVKRNGIDPNTRGPYWNMENVHIDGPTQSFKGFRASTFNIENKLIGVESYKVPRSSTRISFSTKQQYLWEFFVANLGKWTPKIPDEIAPRTMSTNTGTSTTTVPKGDALSPIIGRKAGENRNFLLTSVSISEATGIFKVSVEFMQSGPFGWNPIIYEKMKVKEEGGSTSIPKS
jgi:hypothetical protein